ncbi:alpha-ketoglutarate-dependent dioxygenase AlkB [Verrucomicrobiaceae bacterium R5-34]|uniref:Alpha-ketoglutarate-dependent dioxygenase AlkB n=1 Tax=Oceaniferula flava TaxID=2800421 RepID=A0AAE2SBW1_9BACT|nr:alpha-ketoglutarate-dependent dioxygenase AlkB [Oceaniferula flavus]MBK1832274.1 alpha-ketoglutarate-dependent dioxygenase AlkB [Verrucomicrobiaceae bacterium R5-34]MBK1854914.1 alpha-ketoglutarate-dependent dioxygenase AlkB [Oceaniferula flavus]MBM1136220.1 alpha-ketoglutarate-dependent dioxygenase AlkB [Oceaniferula flavus]
MNLFPADPDENLLPADGIVHYHGPIFPPQLADRYLHNLLEDIPWKHDEVRMYGKHITTARKVAWYGDSNFSYTYSGTTKQALPWTPELAAIKAKVEALSGTRFNSCLLNLYHDGGEGMAWHSDDESSLGKNTTIASVSFGAERKFSLKHRVTGETVSVELEHGSLLEMKGATQSHWLHCVPKTKKVTAPRVNLTFRTMKQGR